MIEGHLSVGDHVTATLAGVRAAHGEEPHRHAPGQLGAARSARRRRAAEGLAGRSGQAALRLLARQVAERRRARAGRDSSSTERIEQKLPVYAEDAPQEQALKINGLRAVFGEKYPPMVRVVSIGVPVADLLKDPANAKWRQYSIEFCGGTHLKNTGDVDGFVVTAEESVSKGIRRIVALTGDAAAAAASRGAGSSTQRDRARAKPPRGGASPARSRRSRSSSAGRDCPAARQAPRRRRRSPSCRRSTRRGRKSQQKAAGGAGVDAVAVAGKLLAEAHDARRAASSIVGEIPGAATTSSASAIDSLEEEGRQLRASCSASADGREGQLRRRRQRRPDRQGSQGRRLDPRDRESRRRRRWRPAADGAGGREGSVEARRMRWRRRESSRRAL